MRAAARDRRFTDMPRGQPTWRTTSPIDVWAAGLRYAGPRGPRRRGWVRLTCRPPARMTSASVAADPVGQVTAAWDQTTGDRPNDASLCTVGGGCYERWTV
jgi:hypothetical protein